jgi:uncharacterized protein YbbC (DUF1343 family)/CubicO group peptidase (beta-lactamase class C family)
MKARAPLRALFGLFLLAAASAMAGPLGVAELAPIADAVQGQIEAGRIPGAVVLIGQGDRVVYRRAFGYRALGLHPQPMTGDTIFDLASVTKTVATTTAVMQLVEQGRIGLDDPAARYWPVFGANGKEAITVRQLLTHYSGLRADLDQKTPWSGYDAALRLIAAERPVSPPGSRYLYSDINFAVLGELVRRVSGESLDAYCAAHIFRPLGMMDTGFRPPPGTFGRVAPTERLNGRLRQGEVHDPTAYRMGGVAGHAGLFGTADDLAVFARMLLHGGTGHGARILDPRTVEEMALPQSPPGKAKLRGLGWDLAAPFASDRDAMPPVGSFGHTGFTGTLLWIDPTSDTYVILLTNRLYPDGKGDAGPLRKEILELVSAALGPVPMDRLLAARPALARYFRPIAVQGADLAAGVQTGADILAAEGFAPLKGLRVGLITNHTGLDRTGNRTIDLLHDAPGVKLAAIFSPEHGLYGIADEKVASGMEPGLDLPVFSLYGEVRRPTGKMLAGLDALVFDVQDAGARFYTYVSTMAYAMEAAARRGIPFYVLDRPNPITASAVQGPVMDPDLESFTGYFPLPTRHGMTVGELARLFNAENGIGADLHVVAMRGYRRGEWYDQTGLPWVAPSPNLRTLTEAALYPGVAMVEGANVSVGRGTDSPFELVGAPWIDGERLAAYLNGRKIAGVMFQPTEFTPTESRFKDRPCHGVRVVLADRDVLDAPALGVEIVGALHRLYPADFQLDKTLGLVGARWVLQGIREGEDPRSIARRWQSNLAVFQRLRAKYLLY